MFAIALWNLQCSPTFPDVERGGQGKEEDGRGQIATVGRVEFYKT